MTLNDMYRERTALGEHINDLEARGTLSSDERHDLARARLRHVRLGLAIRHARERTHALAAAALPD